MIKFPKGVDKAQVAKMMTDRLQTLEMDLQKAAKAWEKTYADSVDKAKVIQTAIDKLKDQMKNAGGKNDDPWWKGWFGKGVGNGGVSNLKNLITIMELNLKNVDIPIDEQEKVKSVIEAVKELKCDMVHEGFYEGLI